MSKLSLLNAHVIDPASKTDTPLALHIQDDKLLALGDAPPGFTADKTLDATGLIACPGLVDLYARLREPGFEKKADIASETQAALYNGFTTLVCSPDTDPVIDEVATVELIHRRAVDAGFARVRPLAAMTRQLDGERLSELATLTEAGCVGAAHADVPFTDTLLIRRVMEYARTFNIVLMFSPVDQWLAAGGCAHEGRVATRLGLPGIPIAAETVALSQLLELAHSTGARVHFSRITSARGAELIRDAKSRGMLITADTSINHLFFTENELLNFDSLYHSVAPFRSEEDRLSLRAAAIDGTLDAICSDHAPHERDAKLAPFPATEPGMSTLDTYLGQLLEFGQQENLPLVDTLKLATCGPSRVFDLDSGEVRAGVVADLLLFDADATKTINLASIKSRGKNVPRQGDTLPGAVRYACVGGVIHELS